MPLPAQINILITGTGARPIPDNDFPMGSSSFPPTSYSLLSPCPSLRNHISASLKTKIWSSAFFELSLLFSDNPGRDDTSASSFHLMVNPDSYQLMLKNQSSSRVIANIFEWTTAFHTYTSIFIERHTTFSVQGTHYIYLKKNRRF